MIRVVSYNVHACVGRDGRFMPDRVADVLEPLHADFVSLQEIEDRDFAGKRVVDYLAARLGARAYRGMTLRRDDADYGNLILARHAALAVRCHDLSVPGGEPRGMIEAEFLVCERRLRLFATHLGLRTRERSLQVDRLLAVVASRDADLVVLAGDINEWRPGSAPLRSLRRALGPVPLLPSFPTSMPLLSMDRIYVAPADCVASRRVESSRLSRSASDHLPVVCDLRIAFQNTSGT